MFKRELQGKLDASEQLTDLINHDAIVVDVGAGYGANILTYLENFAPRQIYAFEPLPHNIKLINENVTDSINFFPCACGDVDEDVKLYVPCGNVVEGRKDRNGIRADYIGVGHVRVKGLKSYALSFFDRIRRSKMHRKDYWISVNQVRLDSVLPAGEIGLLKIDVQGHEERVLRGLGERLNDVAFAYIEFSPKRQGILEYLKGYSFSIYDGKYLIFGPQDSEGILESFGFCDVVGFKNSLGNYRYDCSLSESLKGIDVFSMPLPKEFRVAETDLIVVNKRSESDLLAKFNIDC